MSERLSPAPKHLDASGKRLWRAVLREYRLDAAHSLALLEAVCMAYGQMLAAGAIVAEQGLIVEGRYGPREHPALKIERDAREALRRAVRELALDPSEVLPEVRPPRIGRDD